MKSAIQRFFAQFGTTVVLVGLCAYLVLQLTLGIGEVVDVEHTTYTTVQDTIRLDGYIFREEIPLSAGGDGTTCYLTENGERVSVNTQVAITYSDAHEASVQEQISRLDRMIRILEQSNLSKGALTTDLSILDERIDALNIDLLREVADDDLAKALRGVESLWVQLNRRQALLSGKEDVYTPRIKMLEQQKQDLNNSLTGSSVSVFTDSYGYFYHAVDGYERIFTNEALETLTVNGFESLIRSKQDTQLLQTACGKLIPSSAWHIAAATDKRTASGYQVGYSYEVVFPYSSGISLSMRLEQKIAQTDLDTVILVFGSRALPDGFDFSRSQIIQLVAGTYSGIRVSADALRMLDGELGCYVLDGTRVIFKKAKILYRNEEYAICEVPYDEVRENNENKAYISPTYLSLYDTVITSGSDLYVGKVLQ